jgi:uncharacterized protein GlcG (DUF336 family)
MKTKPLLTLEDAKRMAAAAEAEALGHQWNVAIAICDDGGHLMLLHRLDGVAPISSTIAPAKARAAALGKRETKLYEDMIIRAGLHSYPHRLTACSKAVCRSSSTATSSAPLAYRASNRAKTLRLQRPESLPCNTHVARAAAARRPRSMSIDAITSKPIIKKPPVISMPSR